jgi:hypothetical protein
MKVKSTEVEDSPNAEDIYALVKDNNGTHLD